MSCFRRSSQTGAAEVRIWSAGCASGEEPYTIALLWHLVIAASHPSVMLELVATDADAAPIERARRGVFAVGSARELPASMWRPSSGSAGRATLRSRGGG